MISNKTTIIKINLIKVSKETAFGGKVTSWGTLMIKQIQERHEFYMKAIKCLRNLIDKALQLELIDKNIEF
jgi:hypothetical protein